MSDNDNTENNEDKPIGVLSSLFSDFFSSLFSKFSLVRLSLLDIIIIIDK